MRISDHDPFQLKLNASDWFKVGKLKLEKRDFSIFSYNEADCKHIEAQIEAHPFLLYCYTNVDVMVDLWYEWLFNIFEENIPMKTKHRLSLPPWVSKETSNFIKRRNTQKKTVQRKPSESNQTKLTLLQNLLTEQLNNDQRAYADSVFKSGRLSEIQKYFKSIRKSTQLPSKMYLDGEKAITDLQKAELFNKFFR